MLNLNKFHQVAIYTEDADASVAMMRRLGYEDWLYDEAVLIGTMHGIKIETRARMWFNYEFGAGELEFLTYEGDNWHEAAGRTGSVPFLSHKSVYTDDVERDKRMMVQLGFRTVQEFETHDHINKYLIDKKQRFRECIFDTRDTLGFDVKFIQRIFD